jgi:hypothetical protein
VTYPGKSLNAGLTSRAAITSPSSPTLPHARLNPRHSSTLYDAHEPRLRLGGGELGKHSDKLRQASYSDTSSIEGYDPARECFMVGIGDLVDGTNAMGAGDEEDPRTRG